MYFLNHPGAEGFLKYVISCLRSLNKVCSCFQQTASGVSSKVMDDYCWIHSTFHVRSEFQGNVGCILDRELLVTHHSASVAHAHRMDVDERIAHLVAADTPDTAFYQWVPFTLIFQVGNESLFYHFNSGYKNFFYTGARVLHPPEAVEILRGGINGVLR